MHMSQNFSNKMFLLPELTVAGTYCSCVACFDLPKIRMFLGRHEKLQSDQIMSERERERERHRSCQGATRCKAWTLSPILFMWHAVRWYARGQRHG